MSIQSNTTIKIKDDFTEVIFYINDNNFNSIEITEQNPSGGISQDITLDKGIAS